MAHLPKGQGIFLPPFKAWLASNIPAVYDNTMSYYEELVALIKYLQDIVVPAVNDNAAAVTAISEAQETLQAYVDNYFDNLDVQEEINNKLDQMAEDGTLQEIITQYIQANTAWCFDTVASMKTADNLINGSFAQTLGYHSKNDGGASLYKIRTITNDDVVDEGSIIALADDTLVAELILNSEVNVKQFGCYGDDTHDDTAALQNAINFVISNYQYQLNIPRGFYLITSKVTINERCRIVGIGSRIPVIKGSGENSYVEITKGNNTFIYRLEIKNVSFSADSSAKYALYCDHINESSFENVEIGYGTVCDFYAKNMEITNFYNCRFTNSTLGLHLDDGCVNNIFYTCNFWDNATVVKMTTGVTNTVFNDTWFEKWDDHCIDMNDASDIVGLTFNNCYFLQTNNTKTSSNMFTENVISLGYRIEFDKCLFLFPYTTDSTISLFHISMNSAVKRKFINIDNCSLIQKGNMKSWIDDANVLTPTTIQVEFKGTKWADIPYLSDNKCKIHGLVNLNTLTSLFSLV